MSSRTRFSIVQLLSLLTVVLLLAIPARSVGAASGLSSVAPFRGEVIAYTRLTHSCGRNFIVERPAFNKTTGIASAAQASIASGSKCPGTYNSAAASAIVEFDMKKVSGISGVHTINVTWNVTWTVNLTEAGGFFDAQSKFFFGSEGTSLCWKGPGNCTPFANGGGPGGSNPGWGFSGGVPTYKGPTNVSTNTTSVGVFNTTLNYTFNPTLSYGVWVGIGSYCSAWAYKAGSKASTEVWWTARLVAITVV